MPSYERARMLDALMRELVPTCRALGVPIFVSDNGSRDATPEVCARWAAEWSGFRFQRHPTTLPIGENVMSAIAMSDAEYTWFAGDDDYLVPDRVVEVFRLLTERSPSAVVVHTVEVPRPDFVDLGAPVGEQLSALFAPRGVDPPMVTYDAAASFFAAKHYRLPAPSVIYRTEPTLATDYARYLETHHAHIGALFDALAQEQQERGRVEVLELREVCSVSLTVHDAHGKRNWSDIFRFLANEGFPRWFAMLPAIYAPHLPEALAFHRHIFRAALEPSVPAEGDAR